MSNERKCPEWITLVRPMFCGFDAGHNGEHHYTRLGIAPPEPGPPKCPPPLPSGWIDPDELRFLTSGVNAKVTVYSSPNGPRIPLCAPDRLDASLQGAAAASGRQDDATQGEGDADALDARRYRYLREHMPVGTLGDRVVSTCEELDDAIDAALAQGGEGRQEPTPPATQGPWCSDGATCRDATQCEIEGRCVRLEPVAGQEPVAWMVIDGAGGKWCYASERIARDIACDPGDTLQPLYTHPAAAQDAARAELWRIAEPLVRKTLSIVQAWDGPFPHPLAKLATPVIAALAREQQEGRNG